jgi:hypothetical protein
MKSTAYALCIFLLAIALYWPSRHFDFAFDDVLQITHNQQITDSSVSASTLFTTPTPPGNLYRPLTLLTYKFQFRSSALNPAPYHVFNILLFGAVGVLVYLLSTAWLRNKETALLASALFVAHPLHTEAVANIIGRAELLSAFWGILCCLCLKGSYETKGAKSALFALLSAAFLLLASLSKESALTFLILAPLFVWSSTESIHVRRLASCAWPLCIAAATAIALRFYALGGKLFVQADTMEWVENPLLGLSFTERLIPALKVLGNYILLAVAPIKQSIDYSATREQLLAGTYSLQGALLLGLLLVFFSLALKLRVHSFAKGALWFAVAFSLTANIVTPIGTIMGERLMFTPLIGYSIFMVGTLLHLLPSRSAITQILLCLLIGLFSIQTVQRGKVWQNNTTLFGQLVQDRPDSAKAHYIYAVHMYLEYANDEAAEFYLRRALDIFPNYLLAERLMAHIMLERKDYGRAVYWHKRILAHSPEQLDIKQNLEKIEAAFN